MPVVLARVDDRLIHGQVVEGWLRVIQADRIVVASDEAAADPLQVGLMRLAVPVEVRVEVEKVQTVAEALKSDLWKDERVLLLLPGVAEARRLVENGARLESLNLGGLHDAPGRRPLTPFLALSQKDREDIRFLLDRNVFIETRALPTDDKRSVTDHLGKDGGDGDAARDVRPQ